MSQGASAIFLLVIKSDESDAVHVSAMAEDDKSEQQLLPDHTLIQQSDMQSIPCDYQVCFPESLLEQTQADLHP